MLHEQHVHDGLTCQLVGGEARCRPPTSTSDGGTTAMPDEGARSEDASTDATPDAAPALCTFAPSAFECKSDTACVSGPDVKCTPSTQNCSSTELSLDCFSSNYCSKNICCLKASQVTGNADKCADGVITLATGDYSKCSDGSSPSELRLCQSSADCPEGSTCGPFSISSSAMYLKSVVVGACR